MLGGWPNRTSYGGTKRRAHAPQRGRTVRRKYTTPNRSKASQYRSRPGTSQGGCQDLCKQVKNLQKSVRADVATHTRRYVDSTSVAAASNLQGYGEQVLLDNALIEGAMSLFRYFNPSDPGNPIPANAATGTYQRDILVKRFASKVHVRAAGTLPADVDIYIVVPKEDTSITPITSFTNGMTDQMITPTPTFPDMYLTDSVQFNSLWKIVQHKKKVLSPGDTLTATHYAPSFRYNPSIVDSHAMAYQSKYKAAIAVIFVNGVIAHSSTNQAQVGLIQTLVDVDFRRTIEIEYDSGGIALNDLSTTNSYSTLVTPVVGQIVRDNQSYSLA